VDETPDLARGLAELWRELAAGGALLLAPDAFIAGAAAELDSRLVADDADLEIDGIGSTSMSISTEPQSDVSSRPLGSPSFSQRFAVMLTDASGVVCYSTVTDTAFG